MGPVFLTRDAGNGVKRAQFCSQVDLLIGLNALSGAQS